VHEETSPAVDIGGIHGDAPALVLPKRHGWLAPALAARGRCVMRAALPGCREPKDDDDERADILYAAYDTLEGAADLYAQVVARDPDQPDALEHWESLRARYRKPEPTARQHRLDTQRDWSDWERWCDGRIAAALEEHDRAYDKAVGRALGEACNELRDEIAALRRELATARKQIKQMEQRRNVDSAMTVWHINRKLFTATPFDADGKPGTPINLRGLF